MVSLAVEHCAMSEQPFDGFQMTIPRGQLQRLFTVPIGAPDIGTTLKKQGHHRDVSVPGGNHQPRTELILSLIHI